MVRRENAKERTKKRFGFSVFWVSSIICRITLGKPKSTHWYTKNFERYISSRTYASDVCAMCCALCDIRAKWQENESIHMFGEKKITVAKVNVRDGAKILKQTCTAKG